MASLFTFVANARAYNSTPNPDEVDITRIADDLDDMSVGDFVGIVGSDGVFRYGEIVTLDDSSAPECVVSIEAPSGVTAGNIGTTMPVGGVYYVYSSDTVIPSWYNPEAEDQESSDIDRMFYSPVINQLIRSSSNSANTLQVWYDLDEELDGYNGQWVTLDSTRRYCDHAQSQNRDFVLSNEHLRRISEDNTSTVIGWVPQGLSIMNTLTTDNDDGVLSPFRSVAYRCVIGSVASDETFSLGAPSGRLFVYNFSEDFKRPTLYCSFALGADTNYFIQLYRTNEVLASDVTIFTITDIATDVLTVVPPPSNVVVGGRMDQTGAAATLTVTAVDVDASTITVSDGSLFDEGTAFYHPNLATTSQDPGDEPYLVFERFLTQDEIDDGIVTIVDTIPFGGGGPSLYTNQDQETPGKGNFPCECVCGTNGEGGIELYNESLHAWNYRPRSSIELNLLKPFFPTTVSSSAGGMFDFEGDTTNASAVITNISPSSMDYLQVGMEVINVDDLGTSPVSYANTRQIVSIDTGAGTVTTNLAFDDTDTAVYFTAAPYLRFTNNDDIDFSIFFTCISSDAPFAISLASAIGGNFLPRTNGETQTPAQFISTYSTLFVGIFNAYLDNEVLQALYLSGPDDLPGHIFIQAESDRDSSFYVQSFGFDVDNWYPDIYTDQVNIKSKAEPELIQIAKPNNPLGWALEDFFRMPAGSKVLDCKTIMGVMVIETSRGYYRKTGNYFEGPTVDELNLSLQPLFQDDNPGYGITVVDNVGFSMTTRGLCAITETNAVIVPNNPKQLIGLQLDGVVRRLSADENKGIVRVPTANGTWEYNVRNNTWTSTLDSVRCGAFDQLQVKPAFHIGDTTKRKRDSQESAESFFDYEYRDLSLDDVVQYVLTFTDTLPSGVAVGDVIEQGELASSITAIDGQDVTVDEIGFDSEETVTIYVGYNSKVVLCPVGPGIASAKTWVDGAVTLDSPDVGPTSVEDLNVSEHARQIDVYFKSDLQDDFVVGGSELAEPVESAFRKKFWFPREVKYSENVTVKWVVRVCKNFFKVIGLNLNYDVEDSADSRNRGKP